MTVRNSRSDEFIDDVGDGYRQELMWRLTGNGNRGNEPDPQSSTAIRSAKDAPLHLRSAAACRQANVGIERRSISTPTCDDRGRSRTALLLHPDPIRTTSIAVSVEVPQPDDPKKCRRPEFTPPRAQLPATTM